MKKPIFDMWERYYMLHNNNTLQGDICKLQLEWYKCLRELGFYKLAYKLGVKFVR